MDQNKQLYELIGWLGVGGILLSYGLLAVGLVDSSSYMYHGIVLVSSLGVATISRIKHAYQPFVLNVIFALFAIIALIRLSLFA